MRGTRVRTESTMRSGGLRRTLLLLVSVASMSARAATASEIESDADIGHARAVLEQAILFDGHNDLPFAIRNYRSAPGSVEQYELHGRSVGQTDFPRLQQGGIGAQLWSVYIPNQTSDGAARTQLEQIDLAKRLIARYPERLQLARSASDVYAAHAAGRIASLLGMEGGYGIENSLALLRSYYELGVRAIALTHNAHTEWAEAASLAPSSHAGLTAFGEEVVVEMNRLGMLVDLSHAAPQTMRDTLRISRSPVIFSHSAARALCDVPRNVPDDVLRLLRTNGGVVMVAFVASFINPDVARAMTRVQEEFERRQHGIAGEVERIALYRQIAAAQPLPRTTIADVADHIEYIRDVAGSDHVGIGGDYDGNDQWPEGLEDVSGYPKLFAELIRRGWPDEELAKLAGRNMLRVLERAEAIAREGQQAAR